MKSGSHRLAAFSILFFALAAGPAAAAGISPGGSPQTGSGTTSTDTTPTTTSTTTTTSITTTSPSKSTTTKQATYSFGSRLLSLGMSGSDVLALQHDLTALGFSTPATGRFTGQTQRRLKQFQRRYGLQVDGIAGPSSIGTLKRLLSSKLHITESALAAKELANGERVTSSTPANAPLPPGDSGLTGGVGIGPVPTSGSGDGTGTGDVAPAGHDASLVDGLAVPAPGTPTQVVRMLEAANRIAFDPYIYGGGHASFISRGYDCSGSVSYVLHAGGLLATPLDSSQFVNYGLAGKGNWVTVYTNGPTHAYMEIAGLWFDTAAQTAENGNDRWSPTRIGEPGYGTFIARHPAGM